MSEDFSAQNVANVMSYPNTLEQWGVDCLNDPAANAAREIARVQRSILVLQQAQSIRDDKALMEKIRKHLREENARILATLEDLDG